MSFVEFRTTFAADQLFSQQWEASSHISLTDLLLYNRRYLLADLKRGIQSFSLSFIVLDVELVCGGQTFRRIFMSSRFTSSCHLSGCVFSGLWFNFSNCHFRNVGCMGGYCSVWMGRGERDNQGHGYVLRATQRLHILKYLLSGGEGGFNVQRRVSNSHGVLGVFRLGEGECIARNWVARATRKTGV